MSGNNISELTAHVKTIDGRMIHPVVIEREAMHEVYRNGVISHREVRGAVMNIMGLLHRRGRRPSNGQFSMSSRRRLRTFVISHDINQSTNLAITLTLPNENLIAFGGPDFVGPLPEDCCNLANGKQPCDYSEAVRRFGNWFHRRFPRSGLVWRNEVQLRGLPHSHLLIYLSQDDWSTPTSDDCADMRRIDESRGSAWVESKRRARRGRSFDQCVVSYLLRPFRLDVIRAWRRCVEQTCFIGTKQQADEWERNMVQNRGFMMKYLENKQHAIRYIVDDMSKHKKEQLGYRGNQWGVVARKNFVSEKIMEIVGDTDCAKLARLLGRLRRRTIRIDADRLRPGCPWSTKRSKYYPADAGQTLLNPTTVARLRAYIDGAYWTPLD